MLPAVPALALLSLCHAAVVVAVSVDRIDEHLIATALIQTNVVGPRAKISLTAADPKAKAADEIPAVQPNETAGSSKQSNSSADSPKSTKSNSSSESQAPAPAVESNASANSATAEATSSNSTHNAGASSENSTAASDSSKSVAPASNATANASAKSQAEPSTATLPPVAKVDSSSEEVESEQERQAAEAAREASVTILGWTPDDNATAAVNYASTYDLQNSRGSVLLWTMAATYGALTVLALLIFMICADRQKHVAQLQAEKGMAARTNAMPGPML